VIVPVVKWRSRSKRTSSGFRLDGKELERINQEVRDLNRFSEELDSSPMDRFAQPLFGLPR
jgi:hypothetical protein